MKTNINEYEIKKGDIVAFPGQPKDLALAITGNLNEDGSHKPYIYYLKIRLVDDASRDIEDVSYTLKPSDLAQIQAVDPKNKLKEFSNKKFKIMYGIHNHPMKLEDAAHHNFFHIYARAGFVPAIDRIRINALREITDQELAELNADVTPARKPAFKRKPHALARAQQQSGAVNTYDITIDDAVKAGYLKNKDVIATLKAVGITSLQDARKAAEAENPQLVEAWNKRSVMPFTTLKTEVISANQKHMAKVSVGLGIEQGGQIPAPKWSEGMRAAPLVKEPEPKPDITAAEAIKRRLIKDKAVKVTLNTEQFNQLTLGQILSPPNQATAKALKAAWNKESFLGYSHFMDAVVEAQQKHLKTLEP